MESGKRQATCFGSGTERTGHPFLYKSTMEITKDFIVEVWKIERAGITNQGESSFIRMGYR